MSNTNRRGRISVSANVSPDLLKQVFARLQFTPVRKTTMQYLNGIYYTGYSEQLPVVPEGKDTPDYLVVVDVDAAGNMTDAHFMPSQTWQDEAAIAPVTILKRPASAPAPLSKAGILVHRWLEWARAHGHLESAEGIVKDSRELLKQAEQPR